MNATNEIHLLYLHFIFTSFLFIICGIWVEILEMSGEETNQVLHLSMALLTRYVA